MTDADKSLEEAIKNLREITKPIQYPMETDEERKAREEKENEAKHDTSTSI